jgi:hypothetical protein
MVGSTDFFEINLHDGDGNVLLGIDDGNTGQKLVFDIVNTSDKTIYFNKVEGFVNLDEINIPKNFHFSLLFRPKTLLSSSIDKITLGDQEIKDGWVLRFIKREEKASDKYDIFYIANTQGHSLLSGDRITFSLNNISAAPDGGARGTRVEIKYDNFIFSPPNVDQNKDNKNEDKRPNIFSGNCLKNLNILNQRGKKQVPLYVGFIGSNTILNDGSENTLTLSIQLLPRLDKPLLFQNISNSDLSTISVTEKVDPNRLTTKQEEIFKKVIIEGINTFLKSNSFIGVKNNPISAIPNLLKTGANILPINNLDDLAKSLTSTLLTAPNSNNYAAVKTFLSNPALSSLQKSILDTFLQKFIDQFIGEFTIVSRDDLETFLSLLRDIGLNTKNLQFSELMKVITGDERLLTLNGFDAIDSLDQATKITVSVDVCDTNHDAGNWALVTKTNADTIVPELDGSFSENWNKKSDKQGITPQWSFTCKNSLPVKGFEEILRLKISNIKTRLLAGYANLYIHYENIPGYWDGHITVPIHKGPLVYREYPNVGSPNSVPKDQAKVGCVGIGTDKPQAKLHIKKDSSLPLALSVEGDSAVQGNLLVNNGRLGIGTATLNKEPLVIRAQGTQEGLIAFEDPNGNKKWHIEQNFNGNTPGLNFVETGVKDFRLFIKAGGNVGIGTSNPQVKLEVNGDISVGSPNFDTNDINTKSNSYGNRLYFRGTNENSDPVWIARYNRQSDRTSLRINLGDESSDDLLEIGYTDYGDQKFKRVFYVSTNGSFTTSDITLKKEINAIANSLLLVHQLKGCKFLWKHQKTDQGNSKKTFGFIAQEVEKIIPELVDTSEDGLKYINYNGLIPVCIEAIKEQQSQINQLQQKLDSLTSPN